MAKTFMKNGKWIDNPNQPAVLICVCGAKYIKTRTGQEVCLSCFVKEQAASRIRRAGANDEKKKQEKYNFEKMKTAATHKDLAVRKKAFIEYFERFDEFPSYLFDNEVKADHRLSETIREIQKDPETSKAMQQGITTLINRLPF